MAAATATATTFPATRSVASSSPKLRQLSSLLSPLKKPLSFSSSPNSSLTPLCPRRLTPPLKYSTATKISAAISVGEKLPDSTLSYFDASGELQTISVSDLTAGKRALIFAVPGAFTPTRSKKNLPGFVKKVAKLKAKGIDIACVSVNDASVMKAWKKDLKIGDKVMLLSDGNGDFIRAIGCELDLSDKPVGLGVRSRRYAMYVEDGVVKTLNLKDMLKAI
ncbi:Peroxiredoxin-2E- chloroplastic [Striga hermonthica]|uniref:Glutaredoxin-dependent peroxiredoxin n=1 Tax=Striga hermonthica TaxID=68872 RepID=A0A9N7NUJ5_STRHE|nr:Peroxiredoxin-2E- chloroplastic [Striga hermonthica]